MITLFVVYKSFGDGEYSPPLGVYSTQDLAHEAGWYSNDIEIKKIELDAPIEE